MNPISPPIYPGALISLLLLEPERTIIIVIPSLPSCCVENKSSIPQANSNPDLK